MPRPPLHAKFYEMTDEGNEYSIPYEEILPILAEGGFSGYLSSEYEGQRHIQDAFDVDSVEQVRRQQDLFVPCPRGDELGGAVYERFLICEDSLRNVSRSGDVVGFEFDVRIGYYRGVRLCLVEEIEVTRRRRADPP